MPSLPLPEPHPEIVRLEKLSKRHETPCGDGRIVWHEWGAGPPLVLFHGGTGSWTHWIRNIDALARHYTVYAADLPGNGESDYPDARFHEAMTPEDSDIAEDVRAAAKQAPINMATYSAIMAVGIEQLIPDQAVTLAGFSFGGMVAANVAARIPHKIERLFLFGSAGIGHMPAGTKMLSWRQLTDLDELLEVQRRNLLIYMLHNEPSADELAVNSQTFNAVGSQVHRVRRKLTLLPALGRARPRLYGIWGRFDHTARGVDVDAIAPMLREFDPNFRMHIVENAGHWVMYEGADEFNRVFLDMLLGQGADARDPAVS